jgi:hypothetical protein
VQHKHYGLSLGLILWLSLCSAQEITTETNASQANTKEELLKKIECLKNESQKISDEFEKYLKTATSDQSDQSLDNLITQLTTSITNVQLTDNKSSAASIQSQIELLNKLKTEQKFLNDQLKKFKISGCAFAVDPNVGLIFDNQNPEFNVKYVDDEGNIKSKKYQLSMDMVGIKMEADFRFDFIFFTNTDFNFYHGNKKIELGSGVEVFPFHFYNPGIERKFVGITGRNGYIEYITIPHVTLLGSLLHRIGIIYVSFKNAPGGLFILSIPLLGTTYAPISYISGGSLTPID